MSRFFSESTFRSIFDAKRANALHRVFAIQIAILFLGVFLPVSFVLAQTQSDATSSSSLRSQPNNPNNSSSANLKNYVPPSDQVGSIDFSIGYMEEGYTAPPAQLNGYSDFQEIQARIKAHTRTTNFAVVADVAGNYSINVPDYNSFWVPELYVKSRIWDQNSVLPSSESLGRQKETWNELDSKWGLGLWQPTYRVNPLHSEEMGLLGSFTAWKGNEYQVTVFATPFFLPEQGAPTNFSDGTVTSPDPWFTPPRSSVSVFNGQAPIEYNVNVPSSTSVVYHPSYAARIDLGDHSTYGGWARLSYLYGPANQLATPFAGGFLAVSESGSSAPIQIYPQVQYHQLAGFDFGYRTHSVSFSMSALYEQYDNPSYDPAWTYQTIAPQTLLSPTIDIRTGSAYWAPLVSVSYLHQIGGATQDVGPNAQSDATIFGDPMMFHEAVMLAAKSTLYRHGDMKLEYSFKGIQDFVEQGTVLENEVKFYPWSHFAINAGADFLGSTADPSDPSFISRYRGNDMVFGGIQYVF